MLTLIAAMAKNRVIGKNNQIPWRLSEDLKRFKRLTTGKIVVMGRKTFDSIGKPLPNRINIVVSTNMEIPKISLTEVPPALLVFRDLNEALIAGLSFIHHFKLPEEIMIIGGGKIYEQTLPKATKLELTILNDDYEGDAFFPEFNKEEWKEITREDHEGHSYVTLEKIDCS